MYINIRGLCQSNLCTPELVKQNIDLLLQFVAVTLINTLFRQTSLTLHISPHEAPPEQPRLRIRQCLVVDLSTAKNK
jgi:hypothetical protein